MLQRVYCGNPNKKSIFEKSSLCDLGLFSKQYDSICSKKLNKEIKSNQFVSHKAEDGYTVTTARVKNCSLKEDSH